MSLYIIIFLLLVVGILVFLIIWWKNRYTTQKAENTRLKKGIKELREGLIRLKKATDRTNTIEEEEQREKSDVDTTDAGDLINRANNLF